MDFIHAVYPERHESILLEYRNESNEEESLKNNIEDDQQPFENDIDMNNLNKNNIKDTLNKFTNTDIVNNIEKITPHINTNYKNRSY